MLPTEIAYRTFHISYADGEGTAFSFDRNNKQYLITAKHVIKDFPVFDNIEIFHDGYWKSVGAKLVGHSSVDVSVLALDVLVTNPGYILEPAIGGWFIGQEAFFVGFPLGLTAPGVESLFPTPLLKRATISGIAGSESSSAYYLDALNNKGFSGAPVYLKVPAEDKFKVALIVASYTATVEPVYDKDGNETEYVTWQNSGIMAAFNIKHAIEIIDANPIGVLLD